MRVGGSDTLDQRVLTVGQRKRHVERFTRPLRREHDRHFGTVCLLRGDTQVAAIDENDPRIGRLTPDRLQRRRRVIHDRPGPVGRRDTGHGVAALGIDERRSAAGQDALVGMTTDHDDRLDRR